MVLCVLASVQVVGADLRESANSELNALAPQRKVSPKKTGKGVKKQLAEGQGRVTAKSVKATGKGLKPVWNNSLTAKKRAVLERLVANMVHVAGGTFTMGATPEQGDDAKKSEKPAHEVTLSDYYIGKYEVTQAE